MNQNYREINNTPTTKNQYPGQKIYGEELIQDNGEWRVWKPERSKLAAMTKKNKKIKIKPTDKTLYLGAASGTTASHLSDLQPKGTIYCVEYSPRTLQDLIKRCQHRKNMIPIHGDANQPQNYQKTIGPVDNLYQDITQKNQAEIANKNIKKFLKPDGNIILIIKARSINVTGNAQQIIKNEIKKLKNIKIKQKTNLEPIHTDHMAIHAKHKPK
ncbi:fibrillarin-like rRNA/tRNA 2'-O-methyltransferase [Methanonatronarchaeum sp. AMET-Sl]|uniref:fibrillarin-like rRNA/tRNA 2'-O-methyltransferase n=1 Tax=Methanonatronarchaeum sp. AMET-Sl TaxID=3037654 RepID=UPI00244DD1AF|nr:fibrillarin-like rRNA/tRNA 2'-O-methyltransferase [Methanonatronarchaeum sp. AMET-Sl]WGI16862.1 fibrillarin-like rRNA/tRNA 2'-O-methyltransferase [Methanonatronarchaeum sp. AMET-Sl]